MTERSGSSVELCSFVFFKQKTAYEMRISDWSSDVCSSDLRVAERQAEAPLERLGDEGRLALAVAGGLLVETDGLLEFLPVLCVDGHGLPLGFGRERGLLRPWEKDGPRRAINRARTGRIHTRRRLDGRKIGRATCREGVCPHVWLRVGHGSVKKK